MAAVQAGVRVAWVWRERTGKSVLRLRGATRVLCWLAATVKLCNADPAMKNITISIDDDLYRQARMKAAEQSSSISALFRDFLIRLTVGESAETEFERLAREEQELRAELGARRLGLKPEHNLSRDELHDRHALR